MMKNVSIEWHESGFVICQKGIKDYIIVPNVLKINFYETLLTGCLTGNHISWTDLSGDRLLMNYEYKDKFNVFINSCYCGDLPFIKLSETSIAIPIDTNDTEPIYEIYDSELMETYLLYQSELF